MINQFKRNIKNSFLRPLLEHLKIDKYSRPSLNGLDRKLERYLDFEGGTFLEVGANNGFKQSNTYYYEKLKNWKGILIEPIPFLYEYCNKIRKQSEVFNYICSNPEDSGNQKKIIYSDLMSQVQGAMGNTKKEIEHIRRGLKIQKIENAYEVYVECRTVSEIINKSSYDTFDFMSIDVEGFELQVLKGLQLSKHAPKYLLVETWQHEEKEIKQYLSSYFEIESYLTEKDILFKRK